MKREELLRRLAPCGLNCGKCVAFAGGPVQEHAPGPGRIARRQFRELCRAVHAHAARIRGLPGL